LWWVALENLFDELVVLLGELEGGVEIVFGAVAMLIQVLAKNFTMLKSLGRQDVQLEGRRWLLLCWRQRSGIVIAKLSGLAGRLIERRKGQFWMPLSQKGGAMAVSRLKVSSLGLMIV